MSLAEPSAPRPAAPPGFPARAWWGQALPTPTRRAAVTVAALALPTIVVPGAWPLLLALLVLAVGLDAALAPTPARVEVARELPSVATLDQEVTLAWHVRTGSRRVAVVELADTLAPSLGAGTRRVRLRVGPGETVTARTTLRPQRRGAFDVSTLTVRTRGPAGLAMRQHARLLPGRLEVHPEFRSRREAELRIRRGRILETGLRSARALGQGTEFESLRDYQVDDEFRRIDWAATARTGSPVVRTFRSERNQRVTLLLDSGRLMAGVVAGVPRLDHAMDAALAVTTVATRLGDRAGLVAFSSSIRAQVPPRADRGQLARITEAIFALEPDLTESAYEDVFRRVVAAQRQRSLLVLLTELSSEALAETLVPALPLLLRRHLLVVGSVADPEVERWRTETPASADEAYRAAAAVTLTRARSRTADLLARLGATVVDAPPDLLAGRLADAYLTLKARGRL